MTLLIATKNPGKVQELRSILAPIAIQTPADVGLDLEIEESGHSFRENAALKAMAYAEATDLLVLADDSGLRMVNPPRVDAVLPSRRADARTAPPGSAADGALLDRAAG